MPQLFANNASAMLTGSIGPTDTQLTIDPLWAAEFPVANTTSWGSVANWFKVTLEDAAGNVEVMYCGVHSSSDSILGNLQRGKEGTTARSWSAGQTIVEIRLTKADVEAVITNGFTQQAAASTNAQDFNTLTSTGIVPLTGDGTWTGSTNGPTSAPATGQLRVFQAASFVVQELATSAPFTVWQRTFASGSWSTWARTDVAGMSTIGRSLVAATDAAGARAVISAANVNGDSTQNFSCATATDAAHAVPFLQAQQIANSAMDIFVGMAFANLYSETTIAGFVPADGSKNLSRTAYSKLFAKFGTKYGSSSGSTFGVPDLQGRVLRGWANGSGNDPDRGSRADRGDGTTGDHVGTVQGDMYPAHAHSYQMRAGTGDFSTPDTARPAWGSAGSGVLGAATDVAGGSETRMKNVAANMMIYAGQ